MANQIGSLSGRKVIILAGSSGLGLATAKAAAAEGAKVMVVSGNRQRIGQALTELPKESEGYAADLSKEKNIAAFFEKTGNFDHLVFTAGENISLPALCDGEIDKPRPAFSTRF